MAPARSPEPAGGRGRLVAAAVLTALLLVSASLLVGRLSAPVHDTPSDTSVEAGFARDMQVHHQQAVEMALIVRDLTSDPEVRLLAYDIATSQSQQAGQMFGWLADWGLPQAASEPSMTWMSRPALGDDPHSGMTSAAHAPATTMPGLATPAQLAQLKASSGVAAETLFLKLMIAHHKGGVEMAQALLARSTNGVVTDLARGIVAAQTSEIAVMETMLAAREP